MTAPELSPETLRALYEDATKLRAQLDALIARLEPVLAAATTPSLGTTAEVESPPAPAAVVALAPEERAQQPGPPAKAPENIFSGPLILVTDKFKREEWLTPLGISLEGKPLLEIDPEVAAQLAQNKLNVETKDRIQLYKNKKQSLVSHLGTTADVAIEILAEARWAVVINALEDAALIQAIWPLVERRAAEMKITLPTVDWRPGENAGAWLNRHTDGGKKNLNKHWGQIPPVLAYRPGENTAQWLARHGVSAGPVKPSLGVPYYLLILGRPGPLNEDDEAFISMNFQYLLDIFWGVGRLCFTDEQGAHRMADYTSYAERVAQFEEAKDAEQRLRKEVVYFSTKHELDNSTIRSTNELTLPLTRWHADPANTPARRGFAQRSFIEADATRANLGAILSGSGEGKPPAILFTASHGLGLPLSDDRLPIHQGALVTQDWSGHGPVTRDHWFAGEDLDGSAKVDGMFAFLFACYGAGCPDKDEFIFDEQHGRPQIANFSLIAQLPQRLLANGALGVLGHVERAWTYSFSGTEGAKAQSQPFEDVLARLLQGRRAGEATDQFNIIQGDRAMALTEELEQLKFGKPVEPMELSKLWMARNDARNYALLGDPAARLPFSAPV